MGLFSTYFKQLFSRRERRTSASSSSKNKKSTNNSLRKNSITTASNNQITATTISTSHQSSKEGHSFKYNEDGRRYHGNDEVAYVLPNDDDGIYKYNRDIQIWSPVFTLRHLFSFSI